MYFSAFFIHIDLFQSLPFVSITVRIVAWSPVKNMIVKKKSPVAMKSLSEEYFQSIYMWTDHSPTRTGSPV